MGLNILDDFSSLDDKDFIVLSAIEKLTLSQFFPKVNQLSKMLDFNIAYIQRRIHKLNKLDLIQSFRLNDQYMKVKLKYRGFDALALKFLSENDILASIGSPIGFGKESEVYEGLLKNGKLCAIKIHRLGKLNFRATRKNRNYLVLKQKLSRYGESSLSATHEVKALEKLTGVIPVPAIYSYNRHIIVMERIEGIELQKMRHLKNQTYSIFFNKIIDYIKLAAQSNIIHGDLSAYNILVVPKNEKYELCLIDWPQYVTKTHLNAESKLILDLSNIFSFFGRRLSLNFEKIELMAKKILAGTEFSCKALYL